jgi:hypothetical protein
MMFIFITDTWPRLGYACSKIFYDSSKKSQITSICDDFIKPS